MRLFPLADTRKPFDYWRHLRKNIDEVEIIQNKELSGNFGIELHFYEPETNTINLVAPMKALLDGVICAFHRMPISIDKSIIEEVGTRLKMSPDNLLYSNKAILGEEFYVRPYRNGIKWNPQDNRCVSASIHIEYGAKERCFSGRLYKETP